MSSGLFSNIGRGRADFGFDSADAAAPASNTWYDAIVDGVGAGADEYATMAAAESGITAPATVWVKTGTYAGATLAKAAMWVFAPGCTVNTAVTISGTAVGLDIGVGCTFSATTTVTGASGWIEARNKLTSVTCRFSAVTGYLNGGGWGTVFSGQAGEEAVHFDSSPASTDSMGANFAASQTFASLATVSYAGIRNTFSGVKATSSGSATWPTFSQVDATTVIQSAVDGLLLGCLSPDAIGAAGWNYVVHSNRVRIIGNEGQSAAGIGIKFNITGADDSIAVGNIIQGATGDSLHLVTAVSDVVGVANRLDGAPTDTDGFSTIDANDETAF